MWVYVGWLIGFVGACMLGVSIGDKYVSANEDAVVFESAYKGGSCVYSCAISAKKVTIFRRRRN